MGIEFREGSLVLNAKNQYKLKRGEAVLFLNGTELKSLPNILNNLVHFCLLSIARHGAQYQLGFC